MDITQRVTDNGGYITTSEMNGSSEYQRILRGVKRGEFAKVRHGVYALQMNFLTI